MCRADGEIRGCGNDVADGEGRLEDAGVDAASPNWDRLEGP